MYITVKRFNIKIYFTGNLIKFNVTIIVEFRIIYYYIIIFIYLFILNVSVFYIYYAWLCYQCRLMVDTA